MSVLTWVQTVHKGYQQMTKVVVKEARANEERVNSPWYGLKQ